MSKDPVVHCSLLHRKCIFEDISCEFNAVNLRRFLFILQLFRHQIINTTAHTLPSFQHLIQLQKKVVSTSNYPTDHRSLHSVHIRKSARVTPAWWLQRDANVIDVRFEFQVVHFVFRWGVAMQSILALIRPLTCSSMSLIDLKRLDRTRQ